jgi:hypothetical protein
MATEHVVTCDPVLVHEQGYDAVDQDISPERLASFDSITPEQRAAAARRDAAIARMRRRARRPWPGRRMAQDSLTLQGLEW